MSKIEEAVNYIDIKLYEIHNVPPNWYAEGKPPAYSEHPFRYEVSFSIDEETPFTFTHGRLLQSTERYEAYIAGATPPPFSSSINEMLQHIREVPNYLNSESADGRKQMSLDTRNVETDQPASDVKILWIMTPATDTVSTAPEEQGTKRRKKINTTSHAEDASPPRVPSDDEPPPCVIRVPLYERQVALLESMVLMGKPLELRFSRVLKNGVPHEWEDTQEWYFRAVIPVDLSSFAEPGSLQLIETVPLLPVKASARTEESSRKKVLKKPKAGIPGLFFEGINPDGEHPYTTHGTAALVSVSIEKTLTRLASDRVRPPIAPVNLIPTRTSSNKKYEDSTQQFANAVKAIAEKIMQDCQAPKEENGQDTKNKMQLFESFQSTGQLSAYKEMLTPLVVKVVREKFLQEKDATQEVISELTNELYVYLLDCIHVTLNTMTKKANSATKHDGSGTILLNLQDQQKEELALVSESVWLDRADEAEALREYEKAAQCHQARIASCCSSEDFPFVWTDAANFFVRIGDATRAEQCYREALACDPTHLNSLLGYGDLLLAYNRFEEAAVYLHAAADAKPGALSWGHLSLLCDVNIFALEHGPEYEAKRAHWEREGALVMKEAMRATEEIDFNDVAIAVAEFLLELRLPDLANVCLFRCRPGAKTAMLYARLFFLCEQYENALSLLNNTEGLEEYADKVTILRGDCNAALGRNEKAIVEYKQALCRSDVVPQRCFGPTYVHLGNLLILAGRYNDALGVFTYGIRAWPCSLMWLGAGIAYYRMRQLDAAEECLSESNTLNNLNPRTWAYLALVCIHKGRVELEIVMQQAIMEGLSDPALLTELGRDLVRASHQKLGEICLRKALAVEKDAGRMTSETSYTAMFYLAVALEKSKQDEAKELYATVAKNSQNTILCTRAEEQLQLL